MCWGLFLKCESKKKNHYKVNNLITERLTATKDRYKFFPSTGIDLW